MIALASDCLLFQMSSGESIPFSAEMISVELVGDSGTLFDNEFVRHASKAVFHYFKHELKRQTVSLGEFAGALEKVLRGFALTAQVSDQPRPDLPGVVQTDLRQIATESGKGCELFFFPRLRDEMRVLLRQSPSILHFRGLRGCVKQLAGSRRWTSRCQQLHDQIVDFLRHCLSEQPSRADCSLLVQ